MKIKDKSEANLSSDVMNSESTEQETKNITQPLKPDVQKVDISTINSVSLTYKKNRNIPEQFSAHKNVHEFGERIFKFKKHKSRFKKNSKGKVVRGAKLAQQGPDFLEKYKKKVASLK